MSAESAKAWELLDAGDVPGTMRHLRFTADKLDIDDLARIVQRVSGMVGFDDLVEAASALATAPDEPRALYDFGYACLEHGAGYLAIPALTAALRLRPDSLPIPDDDRWTPARDRITRMLDRSAVARTAGPLDHQDLRGWQFVLTGGVLSTLSPFGFAEGMTGRYAYTQDDLGHCRYGLHRLQTILRATGRRPSTVSPLPDRSSRILGLAAAEILGLPSVPFAPERPDTVVVAYDLTETGEGVADRLRDRARGQLLYEHATRWTDPPAVPADVSTFLHQTVVAPWAERLRGEPDGTMAKDPADDRPAEELAAEITRADPEPDPGDGATPADPDETLAAFAATVAGEWATGARDRVASPGPVPSSRFL